jgi:hypothetical protein
MLSYSDTKLIDEVLSEEQSKRLSSANGCGRFQDRCRKECLK